MRRKTRIIQAPLRRSPRKFPASTSRALPVLLAQDDDEDNGKSDDPQKTVAETYSDSGENGDNGGIGVDAVEKEGNSSPRVGNSGGDSMDSDSLGLGICLRCDVRDGLVLVCGEIGCLIAVHERCMGCDPSFDGSGKFRCPVCEQKRAVSRVEEARRKVMEAKRALARFLEGGGVANVGNEEGRDVRDRVGCDGEDRFRGLGGDRREGMGNAHSGCRDQVKTVVQPNTCVADNGDNLGSSGGRTRPGINSVEGSVAMETAAKACVPAMCGLETVEEEGEKDLEPVDEDIGEDRGVSKGLDLNEGADKRVSEKDGGTEGMQLEVSDENEISETENQNEGADKRVSEKDGGTEGMQLEVSDENEISETENQNEGAGKQVSEQNESIEEGEEELQPEASDELGNAKDVSETEAVVERSKRFKQTAGKMAHIRNNSTSNRSSPQVKAAISRRKAIAKKNASSTFHKKDTTSKKSKQSANSSTIESIPHVKRKRLHWTSEEEQMLREGVQELTRGMNKNISWKSILEFGRQVFHPTRTPVDLRDKWRTMMAKEGSRVKKL